MYNLFARYFNKINMYNLFARYFNKINNRMNDYCYGIQCTMCRDDYYHCKSTNRVYCSCDTGMIYFYNNI